MYNCLPSRIYDPKEGTMMTGGTFLAILAALLIFAGISALIGGKLLWEIWMFLSGMSLLLVTATMDLHFAGLSAACIFGVLVSWMQVRRDKQEPGYGSEVTPPGVVRSPLP